MVFLSTMLILCLWIPLKRDKSVVIMLSRFLYSLIEAGRPKWYFWVGQKYRLDFSLRCYVKKLNEAFSQPIFPHMTCIYDGGSKFMDTVFWLTAFNTWAFLKILTTLGRKKKFNLSLRCNLFSSSFLLMNIVNMSKSGAFPHLTFCYGYTPCQKRKKKHLHHHFI